MRVAKRFVSERCASSAAARRWLASLVLAFALVPLGMSPRAAAEVTPQGRTGEAMPAALEVPIESVPFAPKSASLPGTARAPLDRLAARLAGDPRLRIELLAFAGGSDREAQAHRLSLERALTLRQYLMSLGIPRVRIIVRALGNGTGGGDQDRVDVVPLTP